jgi:hypothetical protein
MGLLIPYHTVGRVAIHDICAARRIPTFAAAADRAAHRARASPCEILRARILLAPLALRRGHFRRHHQVVARHLLRELGVDLVQGVGAEEVHACSLGSLQLLGGRLDLTGQGHLLDLRGGHVAEQLVLLDAEAVRADVVGEVVLDLRVLGLERQVLFARDGFLVRVGLYLGLGSGLG